MANEFELEHAIKEFVMTISSKGTLTEDDQRELNAHMRDTVEDLRLKGLSVNEAFYVAKLRLGTKEELSNEFEKVNGVSMLNKEWVFIIVGVGLSVFVNNLLEGIRILIAYWNSLGILSNATSSFLLATAYIVMVLFAVFFVNRGEKIVSYFRQEVFDTNILIATLFAGVIGFLTLVPIAKLVGPEILKRSYSSLVLLIYGSPIVEIIVRGAIPFTILSLIWLSLQSINKKLEWSTMVRSNNILYVLVLGAGLELLASLFSRGFFPEAWFSPIIFGVVIVSGMLLFAFHNRSAPYFWRKIILLIAFPFFAEIIASIQRAGDNWFSSPLLFFGIGITVSIFVGFLGSMWIKQEVRKD